MYYIYKIYDIYKNMSGPAWYIGLSENPTRRFEEHLANHKQIREEAKRHREGRGIEPQLTILAKSRSLAKARELEKFHIEKECPLFNIQHNQDGVKARKRDELYRKIHMVLVEEGIDEIKAYNITDRLCGMVVIK